MSPSISGEGLLRGPHDVHMAEAEGLEVRDLVIEIDEDGADLEESIPWAEESGTDLIDDWFPLSGGPGSSTSGPRERQPPQDAWSRAPAGAPGALTAPGTPADQPSCRSQTVPSGGAATVAEYGCPCHGVSSASTPPRLPTPEPP